MISIDKEKCIGCGKCVKSCIYGAIELKEKRAVVSDNCTECGSCISRCPVKAITGSDRKNSGASDLQNYRNVWVVIELKNGKPIKSCYELLSKGRRLADRLNEELAAVLLDDDYDFDTDEMLKNVGTDIVIAAENPSRNEYKSDDKADILKQLTEEYKPSCILISATENGRDLAPTAAAKLHTGLTADCTELEINEDGQLVQIRPTFGGNLIASIITPDHRPQMATVRPNTFLIESVGRKSDFRVIKKTVDLETVSLFRKIAAEKKEKDYLDVQESDVLFIAGYGISKESYVLLKKIADHLGIGLGATRKVVDEGWAPYEVQIGQTGKTVAPEVAVCFGVSGALQHTIGLKGSKKIIAVNKDPNCPIFKLADVNILADANAVICELAKKYYN